MGTASPIKRPLFDARQSGMATCMRHVTLLLCLLLASAWAGRRLPSALDVASYSPEQVHLMLSDLYTSGDMIELQSAAESVILKNPKVLQDLSYPSVYQYLGVAQYSLGDLQKATQTFKEAVRVNDMDTQSWIHLGNCYLYQMMLPQANAALEIGVLEKGAVNQMHQLFKARNWMAFWQERDDLLAQSRVTAEDQLRMNISTGMNALDFAEFPTQTVVKIAQQGYHPSVFNQADFPVLHDQDLRLRSSALRIGFISSDYGVHPVAQLIRGMMAMLSSAEHDRTTVYCFSLTEAGSWWKRNITRSVDYMISLKGKIPLEAAEIIRSHRIDVLVDLNGHTLHSGMKILHYRPAPVQISFLGYPMTTGSPYVDFFVSDPVSTPLESSEADFTEKLLLLPTHYIVNDHMQLLGHTIQSKRPVLPMLQDKRVFTFATFSNWQKMDPLVFSAWMSIMVRVPSSVMWFLRYHGHEDAAKNLIQEAKAYGVDGEKRFVFTDLDPWVDHTYMKRAADLILDTSLKNGHTTLIDALFAGVPVVSLEGRLMSNRVGSSAMHSLDLHMLTVNSLKEYVDVAVRLATDEKLLRRLRERVEANRLAYPLFDTAKYATNFEQALRDAWQIKKSSIAQGRDGVMHVFPTRRMEQIRPRSIAVLSASDDDNTVDEYEVKVREAIEADQAIFLHIGGQMAKDGWWTLDANDGEHVDFAMHMANLYPFPDNSVSVIYSSHVLEHCSYGVGMELQSTLLEWRRVLKPGGLILASVPDLFTVASLFVNDTTTDQERVYLMSVLYGGQIDAYDMHKVGFNEAILAAYLRDAGFCDTERVENFGLFRDSSSMKVKGVPISLNVRATACKDEKVHGPAVQVNIPLKPYGS